MRAELEQAAHTAAEEALRTIYGDDFPGCTVSLQQIAAAIAASLEETLGTQAELLALHAKTIEAVHLLSTPPVNSEPPTPEALQRLLGERLDAICNLTAKLIATTARTA